MLMADNFLQLNADKTELLLKNSLPNPNIKQYMLFSCVCVQHKLLVLSFDNHVSQLLCVF